MAGNPISIRLSGAGPLKRYVNAEEIHVPDGSPLSMLAVIAGIPASYRLTYFIGGARRSPDTVLKHGDSVTIVSLVSGG